MSPNTETAVALNASAAGDVVVVNMLLDLSNSIAEEVLDSLKRSILSFYAAVSSAGMQVQLYWFSGLDTSAAWATAS